VNSLAWTNYFQAELFTVRNQFDEGIPFYERAIDSAMQSDGPLSVTAVAIRTSFAEKLTGYGKAKAGHEQYDLAIKTLLQLGGAHEIQAYFNSARLAHDLYQSWSMTSDEVVAEILRCRKLLTSSSMPVPDWYIAQLDFWIGEIQGISGNIHAAMPLLESSGGILRHEFSSMESIRRIAKVTGLIMSKSGQHDQAGKLLREALEMRLKAGMKRHPALAYDYSIIASNFAMQGKYAEANRVLDEAVHFEPLRGSESGKDEFNQIIEWTRAGVQMELGSPKLALELLNENRPENDGIGLSVMFRAGLGEALCADHQFLKGLAHLRYVLRETELGGGYLHDPDMARTRAVAGLCALDGGDRAAALAYAAKARTAFTIQPGVSPYYKKPLEKLDRLLGNRPHASNG
jgi:tetratricopeptide (TPR) repeat protein